MSLQFTISFFECCQIYMSALFGGHLVYITNKCILTTNFLTVFLEVLFARDYRVVIKPTAGADYRYQTLPETS